MPSMRLIFRRALSHPERHRAEGDRHLRRRFRVKFSLSRRSDEALCMLQAHRCSNHVACAATTQPGTLRPQPLNPDPCNTVEVTRFARPGASPPAAQSGTDRDEAVRILDRPHAVGLLALCARRVPRLRHTSLRFFFILNHSVVWVESGHGQTGGDSGCENASTQSSALHPDNKMIHGQRKPQVDPLRQDAAVRLHDAKLGFVPGNCCQEPKSYALLKCVCACLS